MSGPTLYDQIEAIHRAIRTLYNPEVSRPGSDSKYLIESLIAAATTIKRIKDLDDWLKHRDSPLPTIVYDALTQKQ